MVGVVTPMLGRGGSARRFLLGLVVGGCSSAAAVGLLVGAVIPGVLGGIDREVALVVLAAVLAVADVTRRTPAMRRQTPQHLVRVLEPGSLGLVYGLDIGLQFTIWRYTSVLWVGLAGLALFGDPAAVVVVICAAHVVWVGGVLVQAIAMRRQATAGRPLGLLPVRIMEQSRRHAAVIGAGVLAATVPIAVTL